jgi:putative hemin transport protein
MAASTIASDVRVRIEDALAKSPSAMTSMVAKQLGVPEVEVIRLLPDKRSTELDARRSKELIHKLESLGKVHVIVNNGAVVLEAFGQFGNISVTGPFLNVQTESLDMHIRQDLLASVFAVEKPSHMDGVNTLSIQFFTPEGNAAFKVFLTFGQAAPSPERQTQFAEIKSAFTLA